MTATGNDYPSGVDQLMPEVLPGAASKAIAPWKDKGPSPTTWHRSTRPQMSCRLSESRLHSCSS
ncbi:MAG TPA: hypothetical protein PLH72_17480, partial [Vicinamibacterales bacterium]|nr:hypothetical protein [Vicinamibacterales bacterium]